MGRILIPVSHRDIRCGGYYEETNSVSVCARKFTVFDSMPRMLYV
jgi:hypothetical protein